jgi:hypothetical protein
VSRDTGEPYVIPNSMRDMSDVRDSSDEVLRSRSVSGIYVRAAGVMIAAVMVAAVRSLL